MRLFVTAAAAFMVASQAFAGVGSYQQKCEIQNVPYQETANARPGTVVGGAVVGGLVGNAITKDAGGAAVGALLGGAVANEAGKSTVTKYRQVNVCKTVYVPGTITDQQALRQDVRDLNAGKSVSKETVMDVQFTIGVPHDGVWGPKSRQAAKVYLANLKPNTTMYSLVVNDVVIATSADVNSIDQMKKALLKAGVDSKITVNMQ